MDQNVGVRFSLDEMYNLFAIRIGFTSCFVSSSLNDYLVCRGYAECHTAQVVSRDMGFLSAIARRFTPCRIRWMKSILHQ